MIKFIIPAIIVFLIVIFWEKINEMIYKKFNIKINYIVATILVAIIALLPIPVMITRPLELYNNSTALAKSSSIRLDKLEMA